MMNGTPRAHTHAHAHAHAHVHAHPPLRSVETTSGSQLNDTRRCISNLEKQYAVPLGQRLVMGIQIDAKCLEGGLEAVSKRARQERQMQLDAGDNNAMPMPNQMPMPNHGTVGSPDANGMTSIDFNTNGTGDGNGNEAFSFLHDQESSRQYQQQQQQQQQQQPPQGRNRKFGMGFLKKVAARTTDTLERGMQGLAVRMDQGKNADLVRVAVYDPNTNELLGVTESLPVPGTGNANAKYNANANANANNEQQQQHQQHHQQQQQQQQSTGQPQQDTQGAGHPKDLRFEVPLWIPGSRRNQTLLLKVWIQSGATLVLQKANKNYLLGSAMVQCQALSEGVTAVALAMTTSPAPPTPTQTTQTLVPTQTQTQTPRPPPRLQLCIFPDPKFSPILTRGWSLTDPDMSGYSSTLNYLPLDQSYVFPGKQSNHWLVAHERATESTVPLPIAAAVTELAANACDRSLAHAQSVARILRNNRHDHKDPLHKATCHLGVLGVVPINAGNNNNNGNGNGNTAAISDANISVAWRRPDSMFEFEIAANEPIPVIPAAGPTPGGYATVKKCFHPKLCSPQNGDHILPGILQAYGGKMPSSGFLLGGIYFCVTVQTNNSSDPTTTTTTTSTHLNDIYAAAACTSPIGTNESASATSVELWETVLGLEAFVKKSTTLTATDANNNNNNNNTNNGTKHRIDTIQVPLRKGAEDVGHLLLQLEVTLPDGHQPPGVANSTSGGSNYMATLPATDGLVSLVGMDSLSDGVKPYLDDLPPSAQAPPPSIRHQQLNTMGYFFTTQYMEQHLSLRQSACEAFKERARRYKQALSQPEKDAPPHTLRTPKNFRPSSSRMTTLVSGIPFNCHIASLNINVMDATRPRQTNNNGASTAASTTEYPGASFHNVTCGAPADHARGFGNVLTNVSSKTVCGGLRRLEAQRRDCANQLQLAQTALIQGVGQYLTEARKTGPCHHVPARHQEIQQLRWRVFESVHVLHHVTWMCAVRRANVFSQSLGLAVSSFLASLGDRNKCSAGWPAVWAKHGFLVCFEGLLSAAGKELGMIEDASVAIAMLRMVDLVLVPDNGQQIPAEAVQIPSSPFLKWTKITASGGQGTARRFVLHIGIDQGYYAERVPPPLRNNIGVRLYPILFEVGVDIRQWGANTGSNLLKRDGSGGGGASMGGMVDDGDEDDVGIVDDDVLVALNYEAMRKMNCYAHALSPQQVPPGQILAAMEKIFADSISNSSISLNQSFSNAGKDPLPVHPSLAALHSHILSSAGKMNHSILDEAATIAQQLGGGGLVFCKSGKDRTAMHLTYKQCQFAGRYRGNTDQNAILRDARLLRLHGTRLPICEKNVGQALYAFNSLQVKFMPEALKPPMDCLAGFLKGGEIFKGGGIES